MIIIADKPGQLANQLWAYSNMLAIAKDLNQNAIIIFDKNYYQYFSAQSFSSKKVHIISSDTKKGRFIRNVILFITNQFSIKSRWGNLFAKAGVVVLKEELNESELYTSISKSRVSFIESWNYRLLNTAIIKERAYIVSLFQPKTATKNKVEDILNTLKNGCDVLIGVHIRRGDYKEFRNGEYYFEDDVYKAYLCKMASFFKDKKVLFYLFSNERINTVNFEGLNIHFIPESSPINDLWAMSKCDYIIGPFSTFSMWASFWNKVPIYFMKDAKCDFSVDDFKVIIAQDTFATY